MTTILEHKDLISLALGSNDSLSVPVVSAAREALSNMTWPELKSEDWKYTKLNHIKALELNLANNHSNPTEGDSICYQNGAITQLAKVAGVYIENDTKENLNKTAFIENLGRFSPWEKDLFAAANLVSAKEVLFIENQNTAETKSIKIEFSANESNLNENNRILIVAKPNTNTQIELRLNGLAENSLRNLQIECLADDNAHLELNIIQSAETEGNTVFQFDAELKRNAQVKVNHFNISANWLRANTNFNIVGEGADAQVNGIYLPCGNQHIDHHTFIRHSVPHTTSHEWFKGVVAKDSKAVFNGKVFVKKDAQKTDAFQQNNNVILDHSSSVDAKPELEIYADDVKCSHGCTIGQLDEEAIYYLQTRGITKDKARSMVLGAFCQDVLDLVTPEALQGELSEKVENRLHEMSA